MHAKMLMKGAAAAAAVGIGSVAGFCAVRAARMKPARPAGTPLDAGVYHADDDAVKRFQELLRVPTISRDDPKLVDRKPFTRWVPTLRRLYPLTFAACELHMIDEFGMLMRWPGTNPALGPIVMMAHHDE